MLSKDIKVCLQVGQSICFYFCLFVNFAYELTEYLLAKHQASLLVCVK